MSEADAATCFALLATAERQGTLPRESLAPLLSCLGHSSKGVQRRAAQVLSALPGARSILVGALAADTARGRWGAAYALSLDETAPLEAVDVLVEALGSDDGDVRWAARDILLRSQSTIDLVELFVTTARHGSPAQRKMAAYSLRDLHDLPPLVTEVALELLADSNPGVRIAALACVRTVVPDKERAAVAAARLLVDADAGVCRAAAATLGSIGHANETLRRMLETASRVADLSLQRAAQGALRKLFRSS